MQATIIGRMAQRTLSQPEKKLKLTVNSQERSVVAAADTPLLYVLRDQLELTGPRFGCGLAQCGACPVHLAWIDEQVPQCGSCQNGWIMYSAHLLATVRNPSDSQIREALRGLKCRCGSQVGILRAVRRARRLVKDRCMSRHTGSGKSCRSSRCPGRRCEI